MLPTFVLVAVLVLGFSDSATAVCGYDACNPGIDGMINVHVVPHTHDDVGWLRTVDQYYTREVQYILDSVLMALQQNPQRRFSYVEMAYFYRWWNQQTDIVRHIVKDLVNNGRLSFILGGWCMNDEASTHYNSIIDQHTRGLQFLQTNFGTCGRPLVAWQIDPFGHSREQASLFAQMGYDAVYFARIDYQDYDVRSKQQTLEMVWQGSDDLGATADLFTGALYEESYGSVVDGTNWDIFSDDAPVQDDPRLHDYNVDAIVNQAITTALQQAQSIRGNHLMWLMGSDFNYQNANTWFKNLDKFIQYTNMQQATNGSKVNLFYSTPSCYTLAKSQANLTWTTKSDDFFPYAHRAHGFWTGYFTSRAALKGMERATNNYLQAVKQVDAWAQLGAEHSSDYKLDVLKRAMGVVQHHDGVSGTEKQVVAYDYAERLSEGINECLDVVNDAYQMILQVSNNSMQLPAQQLCLLTNISTCNVTEHYDQFTVIVYNPLARDVTWWVRAPVSGDSYTVLDSKQQNVIPSQLVPVSPQTRAIPERNGSIAVNDLIFGVQVPALGISTYFVRPGQTSSKPEVTPVHLHANAVNSDIVISNEYLSLTFDGTTGFLSKIYNSESGLTSALTQKLMYYQGFAGNNSADEFVPSGAYLFRPNNTDAYTFGDAVQQISVVQGKLVQEVRQVFSPWASQVVRLYAGERYAEFEWTVGPIPFDDSIGREVISRYSSDLATEGIFYTDANGRQMLERRRDYRPTWTLNQSEPVAGNYYPVNSRILIKDNAKGVQLTVLNDRSEGGSSIHDGEVELMLHRVTVDDDHLGVDEPLQEKGADGKGLVVRGRHLVFFDTIDRSQRLHRDRALRTFMAPLATFSNTTADAQAQWLKNFATQGSAITGSLPENVHVLTVESWTAGTILLRLEHIYAEGEDDEFSKPVTVQLAGLFKPFNVLGLTELTLSANQQLQSASRLPFVTGSHRKSVRSKPIKDFAVTLNPMQIRTFQVRIA